MSSAVKDRWAIGILITVVLFCITLVVDGNIRETRNKVDLENRLTTTESCVKRIDEDYVSKDEVKALSIQIENLSNTMEDIRISTNKIEDRVYKLRP